MPVAGGIAAAVCTVLVLPLAVPALAATTLYVFAEGLTAGATKE